MLASQTVAPNIWHYQDVDDDLSDWRRSVRHVRIIRGGVQPHYNRLRERAAFSHLNWIDPMAQRSSHGDWSLSRTVVARAPTTLLQNGPSDQNPYALKIRSLEEHWREESTLEPSELLQTCFSALAQKWREDTRFVSSLDEIWDHFAYKTIICLGEQVLPLILEEVRSGYAYWDYALIAIADTNPAKHTSSREEAVTAWIRWGEDHGCLSR